MEGRRHRSTSANFASGMIELNGVRDALATLTTAAPHFYRAPGGLKLIGDTTVRSEGFVLALAVDRMTVVAAASRQDTSVQAYSPARNQTVTFAPDDEAAVAPDAWPPEIRRVARRLRRINASLSGADLAFRSTIPAHAGLGASAALSVAAALALLGTAGGEIASADLIALCRESATDIAPIVATLAQREHALLVDCRTSEATPVPLLPSGTAVVVCDAGGAPADVAALDRERQTQCDEAAALLRGHLRRGKTLRDVSLADFLRLNEKLPTLLRRRTRHVVTENVRVLQTVAALRAQDPVAAGGRLNESHDSLRDDYDYSSIELDVLVSAARSVAGVYGTRMISHAGATVSLVRRDAKPAFRSTVITAFRSVFGREPAVFEVRAADGAAVIG